MILDCDLSQIEWRVAAVLSQDPTMITEINQGVDQHAYSCTEIMGLPLTKENRNNAKILNFRFIYANLSYAAYAYYMDYSMPNFSLKKWEKIIQGLVDKYAGLSKWHEELVKEVYRTGELRGPLGHIWKFIPSDKGEYSPEKIYNYPVQGTAGGIIKLALITILNRVSNFHKSLFINTVHDSLIWDTHQSEIKELAKLNIEVFNQIPNLCKQYFNWHVNVPIDGEATGGPSWGDMSMILKSSKGVIV